MKHRARYSTSTSCNDRQNRSKQSLHFFKKFSQCADPGPASNGMNEGDDDGDHDDHDDRGDFPRFCMIKFVRVRYIKCMYVCR